jgi:uncharacterized protein
MSKMKRIFLIILLAVMGLSLQAQQIPHRPEPPTLVTDLANIIDDQSERAMEQKLVDFFAATSTQIAVVTLNDLDDYPISDFAFRLGEKWGIGDARFNNGILILVKPKTAGSRGEVFIAPGYGLEGVVPDGIAKRIVEQEMIPYFQQGDMTGGIDNAVNVLISLTKGEYSHQQYAKKGSGGGSAAPFIIMALLFFVLPAILGRRRGNYYSTGNKSNLPIWIAMGMLSGMGRKHSGFFGDFSSGSGSFGSGSGSSFGSFGGFGGGRFGGGGAGGSW